MRRLDASVFGAVGLALLALSGCVHSGNSDALSRSFFSDMMYLSPSHSARVSSYDRSGGNTDFSAVKPGDTLELARLEGAGCIRHIYFTIWPTAHYLQKGE